MGYFSENTIVTETGHTIPSFLSRLASSAVDIAITVAFSIAIFFLIYPFGYFPTVGDAIGLKEATQNLHDYQLSSYLYTDENDVISYIQKDDYEGYEEILQNYYFIYQQETNEVNPSPKNYSVQDYNHNVLFLPLTTDFVVDSPYFEFAKGDDGEPDASKIGVVREALYVDGKLSEETKQNLKYYFQRRYDEAVEEFNGESYVISASRKLSGLTVVIEAMSVMPPFIVFYVVLPLASEKRKTIGKRIMNQATIDISGQKLKWYWVLARSVIFIITFVLASFLDNIVASIAVLITVFLVSLGFVTFSRKRRALHDYLARSIVVKDDGFEYLEIKKEEDGEEDIKR